MNELSTDIDSPRMANAPALSDPLEGPWRVVEPFTDPIIVVAQYDELRLAKAHALRAGLAIIGPRYEQLTGRP
jgi:hypothetical protein